MARYGGSGVTGVTHFRNQGARQPTLKPGHQAAVIRQGRLVAPFEQRFATPRGYHLVVGRHADTRPEVRDFVAWIRRAAQQDVEAR